jgi:Ser/Thr protein kinase RdoA (MazF antagonist)
VYSLTLSAADGATRDVVLKLHRPARFKSETDNASALPYAENEYRALSSLWKNFGAAGGRFRVPQPVLLLSEQQAVVTEKCGGERCDKLLQHQAVGRGVVSRKQVISAVEACGEWLAKFHFVTRRQSDKRHVINRLRKEFAADLASCETFGFDRRLIEKAGRYFEANIETVAGESSSIVSQHCDFGPHNIFVSNDTITVIDFEGMQDGLIYDDLAYFLCLIEVMPFYHLTQTMKREISEAFLRGYEKKSFVNKRQLEFYQLPVMIKIVAHNPVFEKLRGNLHLLRRFYRKRTYTKWLEERVR